MIKLTKKNYTWIQDELEDDEVVIWAGQPSPKNFFGIKLTSWWLFISSFFLVYFYFSISLEFKFLIFLVVLVFIFKILNKITSSQGSLYTIYMVTNMRVLFLNDTRVRSFTSYYPHHLQNLEKQINDDGSGDIIFTSEPYINNRLNDTTKGPGLIRIENVSKVGDLLDRLANSINHCSWKKY